MSDALLYNNVVALNSQAHADLRVNPINKYKFAAKVNSLPLLVGEFNEASRFYPILFARTNSGIVPLAMLGLREHENVFVGADGTWDARYVPAYARRYPFIAGRGQGEDLVLCIDDTATCFSTKTGEPLFDKGQPSAMLKNAMGFSDEFQAGVVATESFCKRIEALGLLRDAESVAKLHDGTEVRLGGLLMVDETKLREVDATMHSELFTSGILQVIYLHLHSLGNLGTLVDRLAGRMAAKKGH